MTKRDRQRREHARARGARAVAKRERTTRRKRLSVAERKGFASGRDTRKHTWLDPLSRVILALATATWAKATRRGPVRRAA